MARADVVVHDRLADPRLLELAPGAPFASTSANRPERPVDQERINEILVEEGRRTRWWCA